MEKGRDQQGEDMIPDNGNSQVPSQMTSTAYRQGARNAIACTTGFLVMWFLIGGAIRHFTGIPVIQSFAISFGLLLGLALMGFMAGSIYGGLAGGKTLLDCGAHPSRKLFLANAVIFLIVGLSVALGHGSASKMLGRVAPLVCRPAPFR
jgi:hypothetical protein